MPEQTDGSSVVSGIGWRYPHYRDLLEQKPTLGFIEVHSENYFAQGGAALSLLSQARSIYPVSLHGVGLSLGSVAGIDAWHLDQLSDLVDRIEPVRVSDHASFARGTFNGLPVHAADLLPIPFSGEALDVLCNNVELVQTRLKRRLLVENLSTYMIWKAQENETLMQEPEFLVRLSQRSGCGLLVDVNNIYVNALNAEIRGLPGDPVQHCLTWLDAIPPPCVGEIHLAGHCRVDDENGRVVVDDHGSAVCDAVWTIYQHAVERFGPVPSLIEWDTAIPAFEVLIDHAQQAQALSDQHAKRRTQGTEGLAA